LVSKDSLPFITLFLLKQEAQKKKLGKKKMPYAGLLAPHPRSLFQKSSAKTFYRLVLCKLTAKS
jgi:hypothetical protein